MKYIFIVILLLLQVNLKAQKISAGFNSTASGRSIAIDYSWYNNSREIGLGIGFNINQYSPGYRINEFYHKKLYTQNFHEIFAFKSFYHKIFYKRTNLKMFFLFDNQIRRSHAKSQLFLGVGYDSTIVQTRPEDGILYSELIAIYGPYFWIENMIGIGIEINLTDNIFLRQKVGTGITFILGKDKGDEIVNIGGYDRFISNFFSISLGYTLSQQGQ